MIGIRPRGRCDIAVVVPLYNHGRYIAAALRSVLDQTVRPAEILVIDDGSGDDGPAIARAMLGNERVISQRNVGAHAAINRAVAMTEAPFVAVLNSDDLFVRQKLAWCAEIIAGTPDVGLIAGRVALIDARGGAIRRGAAAEWLARAHAIADRGGCPQLALLRENFVTTTSNMVFSRALWRRLGGFAALRYCHDLDFLMRAYDAGRVVIDRARTHVRYRVHPANTISEDRARLDIELAGVIAATLRRSRLSPDAEFWADLRARGLADLVAGAGVGVACGVG